VTRSESPIHPLALPAIAVAAALWATGAIVAHNLFEQGVTPLELVAARAVITAGGFALLPRAWRTDGASTGRGDLLLLGGAIALVNATYYVSIERLPVAIAIVLQYTGPAFVVAWATVRLRRRPGPAVTAALAVALTGVVLVTEAPGENVGGLDPLGVAMGFGAAVSFATYTLASERVRRSFGPEATLLRGFAIASLVWLSALLPLGWPDALFAAGHVVPVLYVGIGATLVPFLLYVWAIDHVRAERAAIAATLEPVLAALAAWAWLNQGLSLLQVVGGALVVCAVLALQLSSPAALKLES
jgi:DME family drug/metabolite transporter